MISCGVDLLSNKYFAKYANNENFLKKVFHVSELKDKKKLASIFTLKEATMKALGWKIDWKLIQIYYSEKNKPIITLADEIKPRNFLNIDGTISHASGLTIGFVIIEKR